MGEQNRDMPNAPATALLFLYPSSIQEEGAADDSLRHPSTGSGEEQAHFRRGVSFSYSVVKERDLRIRLGGAFASIVGVLWKSTGFIQL